MKAFPWLIAGLAVGAAVVVIALSNDESNAAYGDPDVEDAAHKVGAWGAKQRATGTGSSVFGAAKQTVGEVTGSDSLVTEGSVDQTVGHLKQAAGKAASVVSDAVKDFNRG